MNPSELFIEYFGEIGRTGGAAVLTVVGSTQFASLVSSIRGVFVFVSIILLCLIGLLAVRANMFSGWKRKYYDWYQPAGPENGNAKIGKAWEQVVGYFEQSVSPDQWRQAVVAADKVLYFSLDSLKFTGDTLTEKLYHVTPAEVRNLGDVIPAHRDASFLDESPTASVSRQRAAEIIGVYATALKDLGILV